jgi:uncharacterized membrane protein YkgB
MMDIKAFYHRSDKAITNWMARYGVTFLRLSIGVVFFWFGVLKYFPGLSPAEALASRTIHDVSFGLIGFEAARYMIATLECVIGLGLIAGVWMRAVLLLLFIQMAGTFTPMFLYPQEVFRVFPYAPTLEGQYIIKNLVIISAAFVIGATVRGGAVVAEPEAAKKAVEESEKKE